MTPTDGPASRDDRQLDLPPPDYPVIDELKSKRDKARKDGHLKAGWRAQEQIFSTRTQQLRDELGIGKKKRRPKAKKTEAR